MGHGEPLDDLDLVRPEQDRQLPIVIFTTNAKGAIAQRYTDQQNMEEILLEPEEVITFFHEFGHCLHTLFGQTRYHNLAGTRSSTDYCETFSQFLEYYARDYRIVKEFALHWRTREPVPEEIVRSFGEHEGAFAALEQLNQIIIACVDMVYHGERPFTYYIDHPVEEGQLMRVVVPEDKRDPLALTLELAQQHSPVLPTELGWKRAYSLQHLSNYPAAYYSYSYSRVLSTAIWARFFADDPLSQESGMKLRQLMSLGASMKPRDMIETMLGPNSNPEDLLDSPDLVNEWNVAASVS